jgi:hypothetical protein
MADYLSMENKHFDFESWEAKKIKILAQFASQTEGYEVIIGENKDKDIDRPIRYGKGKSRLE